MYKSVAGDDGEVRAVIDITENYRWFFLILLDIMLEVIWSITHSNCSWCNMIISLLATNHRAITSFLGSRIQHYTYRPESIFADIWVNGELRISESNYRR